LPDPSNAVVRCPECGFPVPEAVPRLDLELAQAEHTEDLRAIANMRRRLADEEAHRTRQDEEVYKAWCDATGRESTGPKAITFGKSRQAAVKRARRDGYKQDQLLQAVRLAGKYRYLVFGAWRDSGSPSDRKDDLIDIFKDEKRIESLLAKAGED
jgi:hypothetical protein